MRKPPVPIPQIGEGKRGAQGRLGYLLRQANATHRQAMEQTMADLGITLPQFIVLTMLAAYPGISSADVARLAFLTPQTVSLIVTNLERAGALTRRAHDVHGRIQHLDITGSGRKLLARCKVRVDAREERLQVGLSARDEQIVRRWLVSVARGAQDLGSGQDSSAATPGKTLPSSHSRKAPPAVET